MGYLRFTSGGSDDFVRSDAANLGPLWSQTAPNISLVSNQANMPGNNASRAVQTGMGTLGNTVTVQARWRSATFGVGVDGSGPAALKNAMADGYHVKAKNVDGDVTVSQKLMLEKVTAGVFFTLGTSLIPDNPPFGPINVQIFKLEVIPEGANNRLKVYRAGNILMINVLDNGVTGGPPHRQLRGGLQDAANSRWDQFSWTAEGGIPVYGTSRKGGYG
jgi:hypothetical protein